MNAVDRSLRKAAKIAGVAYLVSFVIVLVVNMALLGQLLVKDNAETAQNIVANESLFRVAIVGDLFYCVSMIVVAAALYVILRPVNQTLALLATFGRLAYGFVWILVTSNLFTALRLLTETKTASAFAPDQVYAMARLYLTGYDEYYIGLLFWALAATLVGYLWLKSGYIPRWLAMFGIIASAWCVVSTLCHYLIREFPNMVNLWFYDTPMVLFELAVSFLLIFRGPRAQSAAATMNAEG